MSQIKINNLTGAQIAKIPGHVDKWVKIGLSTERADFERAEKAVKGCYKLIGRPSPEIILRMGSPLGSVLGCVYWLFLINILNKRALGSQVGSQVWSQVGSQVGSQVESRVGSQVGSQVRSQVGSQVESQVWSQVGSQVRSQVESQVGSQVESQVWSQVESQVELQVWSQVESQVESQILKNYRGCQFWSGWYAYITYLRDICGWDHKILNNFKLDEELALSCGWSWWLDNICAISDRPLEINRDTENRLHKDGSMSIKYPDGWGFWNWHGVNIPEKYGSVNSENWQSKWLLEEKNAELRRVLIQGLGYSRICNDLKAKVKNKWREYELLEIKDTIDVEPLKLVKMVCPSTGLIHAHRVPPNMDTARNAIKWVNHGVDAEEFIIER